VFLWRAPVFRLLALFQCDTANSVVLVLTLLMLRLFCGLFMLRLLWCVRDFWLFVIFMRSVVIGWLEIELM